MTVSKFASILAAVAMALTLAGCGVSSLVSGVNQQLTQPQLQLAALRTR